MPMAALPDVAHAVSDQHIVAVLPICYLRHLHTASMGWCEINTVTTAKRERTWPVLASS